MDDPAAGDDTAATGDKKAEVTLDTLSTALKKVQETLEEMKGVQAETTRIIANNLLFNTEVNKDKGLEEKLAAAKDRKLSPKDKYDFVKKLGYPLLAKSYATKAIAKLILDKLSDKSKNELKAPGIKEQLFGDSKESISSLIDILNNGKK